MVALAVPAARAEQQQPQGTRGVNAGTGAASAVGVPAPVKTKRPFRPIPNAPRTCDCIKPIPLFIGKLKTRPLALPRPVALATAVASAR